MLLKDEIFCTLGVTFFLCSVLFQGLNGGGGADLFQSYATILLIPQLKSLINNDWNELENFGSTLKLFKF